MAWIEMRILAARLTYLFDFEMINEDTNWARDQQCFTLWDKPDLFAKVIPAKPAS